MLSGLIAAFSFLFLLSCGFGRIPSAPGSNVNVEAIPVELDPEDPGPKRLSGLTFLSGFELRSSDPRFGGLSGLALSADGKMLYAVSDRGYWVSALMRHDRDGRVTALGAWKIDSLLTPEGAAVRGRLTDAEALARDLDGSFIVSFEQDHRLWRYPPPNGFSSPAQSLPTPGELAKAPRNGGIEGVTVLPDGRILAITEEYENPDGSLKGWLIENNRFVPVSYVPSDGFRVTDLAALSNGDVLVLERRVSLVGAWGARIKLVSRASLRAGAQLKGEEIARLDPPLRVDNFEGIAVREDPEAGTFLYLISDDNYSLFQRTLLLQFRLDKMGEN